MEHTSILAKEFNLKLEHANNIIKLIDEGNTIPFIARYRKELTGSCDDQVLREFKERLEYLRNFDDKKAKIKQSITEQGKMTEEIEQALDKATTLTELDDIYRPFRPKRRTRATIAREKGLEPLAEFILQQDADANLDFINDFINPELEVNSAEDAINGAKDIIAEDISDDANLRGILRDIYYKEGVIATCGDDKEKENAHVYEMYFDFQEPVSKIPSHRILAINRGEKDKCLKVSVAIDDSVVLKIIFNTYVKEGAPTTNWVMEACEDSWTRLIKPSLEREIRSELTEKASEQAISMFALNLKPLLMQPPIKGKTVLGLDPAYRTGCKIAVVDSTGKVLDTTVIYPTPPHNNIEDSKRELKRLIDKYGVEVIAIGNGTASKESEIFIAELIKELSRPVSYMVVNEAGASVYSASKLGAEEFPDLDVAERSAVSIARRLQDPLAELVKIDPKSIGVGQYQHDMPKARLDAKLYDVVEDCVNSVGVDLNTASSSLLNYISGLNQTVASNIVKYRNENGAFKSRNDLRNVPRLGPKAFEQAAGFLRIPDGDNILDNTAVHPESYDAAIKLLEYFDLSVDDIYTSDIKNLPDLVNEAGLDKVAEFCGIGVPTLRDIIKELLKPGRDIRDELPPPMLRSDVLSMEDLKPGMMLTGTVRNVVDFGAFVDIGVSQDGLVHISELSNRYVKHPSEIVTVGDIVTVYILSVNIEKNRIALSMKSPDTE